MLKVMVAGLFNRGQQDEYVELEAATRCSLEAPVWDGTHVEAHIIETGDHQGLIPTVPLSNMPSPEERGTLSTFSDGLGKDMAKAMVEGRMQVINPDIGFVPLEITGIPEEEKVFFEDGDFEGLLKHLQETGQIGEGKVVKKVKKDKKTKKNK